MMDRFLIIRLSSLGDIIHSLPAYAALRNNFPEAKLIWIVEKKGTHILKYVPGIDEIVVVGENGWRRKIRNKNQTAIDFQGLFKSGLIAFISGAKKRIGFNRKNLKEPLASLFYTDSPNQISEDEHVISKNLSLLTAIGIKEEEYEFPLQLPEGLIKSVAEITRGLGFDKNKKLVLLNVGAAWETKRWSPDGWTETWNLLKKDGLFPLLLWGNEAEKRIARTVSAATGISIAPFLPVPEVMALIKQSSLLISGDTFALQVACALKVPVVAIFGPTNPKRNGPFRPEDRAVFHELDCSLCYKRTCRTMECLKKITPEEVAAMARELLR
jgi:lipopolysaccharide heptosyltransferase I